MTARTFWNRGVDTDRRWCPVPQIDRMMTRAEYMRWRRESRRIGRYGMKPWHIDWNVYPDRAINEAEGTRIGRQMAIRIRIHRMRRRLGLWPDDERTPMLRAAGR